MTDIRIGCGIDVHRFGREDRPLVVGGVIIPGAPGMIAHSDGDVLLHAVCDAILGALGLGDIGRHFPDDDTAWAGMDSRVFVRDVAGKMLEAGYRIGNLDATLVAERPRLARYLPAMIRCLADDLGAEPERINLKATTTEGMGFVGRGEGIAVQVVVLLRHPPERRLV